MCGINGFNWKDEDLINSMNFAIKHRGPDDAGRELFESVSLSQVRLSIIDLTPAGHNPMFYDKKTGAYSQKHQKEFLNDKNIKQISIVFNGEIYNFQEIKKTLTLKGYHFSTKCDTEVILASYIEWGFECVKKFNGMWAFCIYDSKKNILFCSRDRLGVKPFHYYHNNNKFIFSSELKGILAHENLKINRKENINKKAVQLYFSAGYIPSPLTIYNNIYKLEAGHNLIFDLQKHNLRKIKYYELPNFQPLKANNKNRQKIILEGRQILEDATKIRMIADVPIGAFLSGGLDSSSVVGTMSKYTPLKNLHTFSIGFEKKYDGGRYDETKYINLVKNYFKTKHHHYYFKQKDFEKAISKFSYMYDEPHWDYSGFPMYKVSEMAGKKVKVVLSGDGGDEIFGGYAMHVMGARMELLRKTPKLLRLAASKIPVKKNLDSTASIYLLKEAMILSLKQKEKFYSDSLSTETYKPESYKLLMEQQLKYSLKKGGNNLSEALRIHDLMFNSLQNNFLTKVDRASMQVPIEVRSPFLDYRFVEFSQKIPTKWKTTPKETKVIMREIIKDAVPRQILYRGKQGFEPPLDKWILDKKYEKTLKKGLSTIEQIDKELADFYINKVFKENHKLYTTYKIKLFLFQSWWERWIKN
ncbi:MAG: asparagine synthase (glutamine-hydrolyzing) [Candidatus Nanoarchaeia archaeon]